MRETRRKRTEDLYDDFDDPRGKRATVQTLQGHDEPCVHVMSQLGSRLSH